MAELQFEVVPEPEFERSISIRDLDKEQAEAVGKFCEMNHLPYTLYVEEKRD